MKEGVKEGGRQVPWEGKKGGGRGSGRGRGKREGKTHIDRDTKVLL